VPLKYYKLHSLFHATIAIGILYVLFPSSLPVQKQDAPQPSLPITRLNAGPYSIVAQLAVTPEQRRKGLMFRKEMPQHEGMLFVFEKAAIQCFWMKNTFLPLSTAFVADDGAIVNLVDMAPQTTNNHCSAKPVRFVLEMNQGWFAEKGIKTGNILAGQPFRVTR